MTFVDTSALFALIDGTAQNHRTAVDWLEQAKEKEESLESHNYVVVESIALVHRRLGSDAVRNLAHTYLPALSISYVDADLHDRAMSAYLASMTRDSSLVDHVSFELMRDRIIESAFTFDHDFAREGFSVVP